MQLTKTTTRAFATSIVIVAAGATAAGAAVFHLPILGFGPANAASATVSPAAAKRPVVAARKPQPRIVIKTRYIDDIVHRPAPASAYATQGSIAPAAGEQISTPASSATRGPNAMPRPAVQTQPAPVVGNAPREHEDDNSPSSAEDHHDAGESGDDE